MRAIGRESLKLRHPRRAFGPPAPDESSSLRRVLAQPSHASVFAEQEDDIEQPRPFVGAGQRGADRVHEVAELDAALLGERARLRFDVRRGKEAERISGRQPPSLRVV